ncbi:hemagglutinin repeat-containing protein [Ochrobactrum sp. BTU1]|uniref:hemagglutinin repeat-containing protein n=1 Tax=Ochrobactrum sp. BTU1 TaxID=2840456 RepID=UPI001C04B71A|nr:hemagglutinin repeat-containing protein [Ochrobactrum sp. BTU1]
MGDGDTVIIEAGRDINAVGAQVSAGYDQYGLPTGGRGDIGLIAGNDINLESAKATTENSSKNVSGGVSIDLLNPGVNFNYGQGKGNDTTLTNINTHVTGSGTVYVNSGNDTNLRGATVSGETVIADIGGDLNIESQLDTATAKANQVNVSGGVGTNAQGQTSGGISGSYQTAKGDAAIVSEQSGIHAGEGGFDIKVDGNTKLTGGLITSEADPENNRLETGTLEFEDLDTHSKWKADTYGGGFGASGPLVSPPIKEGESETGKALSAISPGEIIITNPDNQQQNVDDLRRDTTDTNTSLPGIPDLQKLLSEQLKTQQLYDDATAKAAKMIGDYATAKAKAALDNGQIEEYEFWKDGGTGPAILHAIAGGLLGGVTDFNGMLAGMLGGASSAMLAPEIHKLVAQFVKDAGVTGAAAGGTGAAYAGNAYQNNYLTHKEMEEANAERAGLLKAIAECKSQVASTCSGETLAGLEQNLEESTTYYRSLSDTNNAALMKACAAAMTSEACVKGLSDLKNAVDVEYGLQANILGTSTVNTADSLLLGVLNDAVSGKIPANEIGGAYQQALIKDQQITAGVGALAVLTAVGVVVGPEVYAYCLANAASCTAIVTEALDCAATVTCAASGGMLTAAAATKIAEQLEKNTIGWTGKLGEDYLKKLGGQSQAYFPTSDGGRYVDQLVAGVAHESKLGYTSLTSSVLRQVQKDVELMAVSDVEAVVWHFFVSPVTNRGGPSKQLQKLLESNGIKVEIHNGI